MTDAGAREHVGNERAEGSDADDGNATSVKFGSEKTRARRLGGGGVCSGAQASDSDLAVGSRPHLKCDHSIVRAAAVDQQHDIDREVANPAVEVHARTDPSGDVFP